MTASLTRLSPLAHRAADLAALPIRVREVPFLTQVNLRLDPADAAATAVGGVLGGPLPIVPNTTVNYGEVDVLWLGPDEWLLVAPDGRQEALIADLRAAVGDADAAITDVSAQRTTLSIEGPAAAELLARGCAIDLHPAVTPVGSCVQTLLAQTGVVIVVRDEAAAEFRLLVRASFADYLASWLVDACAEIR